MLENQLCCLKCGSLNVYPGMPNVNLKKMPVFCENCKEVSEVDIKIDGIIEDGKMKITVLPSLIIKDFNKNRTQKYRVHTFL